MFNYIHWHGHSFAIVCSIANFRMAKQPQTVYLNSVISASAVTVV